ARLRSGRRLRMFCKYLCDEESIMASAIAAIPLDDATGSGEGPCLAMQQVGLLATPQVEPGGDRRIEDWIASHLDLDVALEPPAGQARRTIWHQLIDRLPNARPGPVRRRIRGGLETAFADWSRFRIAYRRGVTVVRLVDRALVKERHVRELTLDLIELIEAGNHRLILNFQGVEKVGSWLALAIDEVYRRAKA